MKTFEDVFSVLLHNYSSKKRNQLVSPSPLGFLSPGNGGTEGGVKTIEGWERLCFSLEVLIATRQTKMRYNK